MNKNKKREPLLADKFLAMEYNRTVPRGYWDSSRSNLMLAKRFVLDHGASIYCAEMIKQCPRIIADAQDFAIPPFQRTYIELPLVDWYERITDRRADPTGDQRIGYLIVNNDVRCFAENAEEAGIFPIEYHLNQPFSLQQEFALVQKLGTSRLGLDLFYWGESAKDFGFGNDWKVNRQRDTEMDDWQREGLRSLRANHSFSVHLPSHPRYSEEQLPEIWDNFRQGAGGDLRNIIALLIFLNRTSRVRVEREMPFKRQMVYRKPVNLLKHRVITIHVNPVPKLLHIAAGEGIRRRLHDVRGHFCHNEVARTNHHEHDWQEDAEADHLRWTCVCGGLRWWRKEHKRGHEDKGIVTSEYKVKE